MGGGTIYLRICMEIESMKKLLSVVLICFFLVLTACDGGISNKDNIPESPETELGLPERIEKINPPGITENSKPIENEVVRNLVDSINYIEKENGANFKESYDKDGNLLMTILTEFENGSVSRKTYTMGKELSNYTLNAVKEGSVIIEDYVLVSGNWRPQVSSLSIDGETYEVNSEKDLAWQNDFYSLDEEEASSNFRARYSSTFTIDGKTYSAIEDRHQIDDIAQVRIYSIKDTYNGTSSFTYWFGINNALSGFSYLRIDEGSYKGDYYETR